MSAAPSGWGRAVRLGLRVAAFALLLLAALVVGLDVLGGTPVADAVAQRWLPLALVAVAVFGLTTLLFGFVFGHAERMARAVAAEGVAMHGPATLLAGTSQDGALVLTGQRVLFRPNALNLRREPVSVPLSDVREVYVATEGRYGKLVVYLRGGDALAFHVWDAVRWMQAFDALGIRRPPE